MRAYRYLLIALVSLCAGFIAIHANSLLQVATGSWAAQGQMSTVRAGAASVLLPDGRIMIIGGTDANGNPLASTEFFSPDGTFTLGPPMSEPRTGHAALWLFNGEVVVTGGTTSANGSVTNTAEIFDPLSGKGWTPLPSDSTIPTMIEARSGHTMTQLQDGSVLIAGGVDNSGTPVSALETLQIAPTEHFTAASSMVTGRKNHAAAALNDGRVLIVGGTDANGATLASTEIYDPATGSVSAGPTLTTPRTGASATTVLDGTVLIAGGSYPEGVTQTNPAAELASMEIYDPVAGTITASSATMSTARSGHQAFLLPNNNNVLIVGGSYNEQALASADLYTPWTGQLAGTSAMSTARTQATGSALSNPLSSYPVSGNDGLLLIAGGTGQSSAEAYGFATVTTDNTDYAPGETVTISGDGWKPGETVTLTLVEDPNVDSPPTLVAVADASGHIFNNHFKPDAHDFGISFQLTAVGSTSQAQTRFRDAGQDKFESNPNNYNISLNPGQAIPAGITFTYDVKQNGTNHVSFPVAATISFQTPAPPFGSLSKSTISISAYSSTDSVTVTGKVPCTQAPGLVTLQVKASTSATNLNPNNLNNPVNITVGSTPDPSCDTTPPTVSVSFTPNGNGWFNTSSASGTVTATDPSNVATMSCTVDGSSATLSGAMGLGTNSASATLTVSGDGTHAVSCNAKDGLGNSGAAPGSSNAATVQIDTTPPAVTITPSILPNANGWFTSAVTFTASGTDTGSGLSTCDPPSTYSGPDTSSGSVTLHCTDKAGNVGSATYSFNYEAASLTVTATPDRPADSNGWYNHAVKVTFAATNSPVSGGVSCDTATTYSTPDSATASATGKCTDAAGNTGSATFNFEYDATPPTAVSGAPNRPPDHNGWYNTAVEVGFTGTDSVSGLASCSKVTYSGPDSATASVQGSCTDNAGNTSSPVASSSFQYDGTKPTAAIAATGTKGTNDWFTSNVTIKTSATTSGPSGATCTADQSLTTDTTGQTFTGTCTSGAGLTSDAASVTIKRDATPPTVTSGAPDRDPDFNGWYNKPLNVVFNGSDSTSGIASCDKVAYSSPDNASATVTGTCTDNAGNKSAAFTSSVFKYDATVPSTTLSVTAGTPGASGWYTSDVTVHTSGTFSASNGTCTSDQYQTAETTGAIFNGSCTSGAGLTGNAAPLTVKLDKTPPTGVALAVTAGTLGNNGWYTSDVTVHTTGTDSISGASCTADQYQTTDTIGTAFNGRCTNGAGLFTDAAPLTIKRDTIAPAVTLTGVTNGATYTLGAVPAAGCSTGDATSGVATSATLALTGGVAPGVGSYTATCNGATDNAGNTGAKITATYSVQYAAAGLCYGDYGHQILQPINADGSSVFKQGSTTPAKFRVCDANGHSIGTSGVVSDFHIVQTINGTTTSVDETVDSTTPDAAFRWDSTAQQWIYNVSTKALLKNVTYVFLITLNDKTTIRFQYGLK